MKLFRHLRRWLRPRPDEVERTARGSVRIAVITAALMISAAVSADLTLVAQSEWSGTERDLSPAEHYLSEALGRAVRIERRPNPLEHWRRLAGGERPAMALEDPHFADYRVTRSGYRIVAAEEGRQSFSLAARGFLLLDPLDLSGRPVAALPPPSLSTLQLLAFFPDAVRLPRILESISYRAAAARVTANEAVAAVLPAADLAAYPDLDGALIMEELPERAFSVAPHFADADAERITVALLGAAESAAGRRALLSLGVKRFRRGHREAYDGFARLLKGSWGFRELPR